MILQEKNKYHNIYLEYTNGLKQATNDHLNVLEVVNGKAENYAYNFNIKDFLMKNGLYIIIVIFMIVCICINNRLISINSIMTILGTFSTKVFFALGVAGLILLAGTDLSIGRMVTLGSLFTCMILNGMLSDLEIGKISDDTLLHGFKDRLLYTFKYQNYTPESISLMITSFLTGAKSFQSDH